MYNALKLWRIYSILLAETKNQQMTFGIDKIDTITLKKRNEINAHTGNKRKMRNDLLSHKTQ